MKGVSLVSIGLLVAACGGTPAGTTTTQVAPVGTTTSTPPTTAAETTTTTDPPPHDIPQAALFLAAVDDGLRDTTYQGAAFEDPEGFLATGALFCDLLDQGLTIPEVVEAYTAALIQAESADTVSADDLLLGGVILGAAVRILCPQHTGQLDSITASTSP